MKSKHEAMGGKEAKGPRRQPRRKPRKETRTHMCTQRPRYVTYHVTRCTLAPPPLLRAPHKTPEGPRGRGRDARGVAIMYQPLSSSMPSPLLLFATRRAARTAPGRPSSMCATRAPITRTVGSAVGVMRAARTAPGHRPSSMCATRAPIIGTVGSAAGVMRAARTAPGHRPASGRLVIMTTCCADDAGKIATIAAQLEVRAS